jgi:hypothetical protein
MKLSLLLALIVVICACSLCAACTSTQESGTPSPTASPATTASPTVPSTTPISFTPGPTQTMPPGMEIEFQITPDYPSPVKNDLYIAFMGGKGQLDLRNIDVRVTKSTGEVVTGTLQPIKGDEMIISDAKGVNRIEITVKISTGATYKIIDRTVKVE